MVPISSSSPHCEAKYLFQRPIFLGSPTPTPRLSASLHVLHILSHLLSSPRLFQSRYFLHSFLQEGLPFPLSHRSEQAKNAANSAGESAQQASNAVSESAQNAANATGETAQKGAAKTGENIQGTTANIPVVGDVTKGLGDTPLAQKLMGQSGTDSKGYLDSARESANQVVRLFFSYVTTC